MWYDSAHKLLDIHAIATFHKKRANTYTSTRVPINIHTEHEHAYTHRHVVHAWTVRASLVYSYSCRQCSCFGSILWLMNRRLTMLSVYFMVRGNMKINESKLISFASKTHTTHTRNSLHIQLYAYQETILWKWFAFFPLLQTKALTE